MSNGRRTSGGLLTVVGILFFIFGLILLLPILTTSQYVYGVKLPFVEFWTDNARVAIAVFSFTFGAFLICISK